MRECRKYWLMAVISFLRTVLRCLIVSASPCIAPFPSLQRLMTRLVTGSIGVAAERRKRPGLPARSSGDRGNGLGWQRCGLGVLADDLAGHRCAPAAAGCHGQFASQLRERGGTLTDRAADLAVGDAAADADVHGGSHSIRITSATRSLNRNANANDCQLLASPRRCAATATADPAHGPGPRRYTNGPSSRPGRRARLWPANVR